MSDSVIRVFIPGAPKTAGSKRAFVITPKGGGRPRAIVTDDCKTSRDWKGDVKRFVSDQFSGTPFTGPLEVTMTFYLQRPKGHFKTGKSCVAVKPSSPKFPIVKPDVLKLARAVEDACSGLIYGDDAQIVTEILLKRYADGAGERTGVLIEVERLNQ